MLNFTKEEFPDADLTLKTSDDILLHGHRLIFRLASPIFKDMLSLPQPNSETTNDPIPVSEDSETMRQILSLIYPCGHDIVIQDLTLARQVHLLQTATKYGFELVSAKMEAVLSERASKDPTDAFTIFAVARVFNLAELTRTASTACLKLGISQLEVAQLGEAGRGSPSIQPSTSDIEQQSMREVLGQLGAADYQRLLKFYWKAVAVARAKMGGCVLPLGGVDCFNRRQVAGSCRPVVEDRIRRLVESGFENHGPDLEQALDAQSMLSLLKGEGICGPCWELLLSATGKWRVEIDENVARAKADFPRC